MVAGACIGCTFVRYMFGIVVGPDEGLRMRVCVDEEMEGGRWAKGVYWISGEVGGWCGFGGLCAFY